MISKVLTKTGAKVQARGMIYKSVAQKVLLYGSESWGVIGAILKVLDGFHHREAQRITGMKAWHAEYGDWEYPSVDDALEAAGLWPIKEYTQIWQATISAKLACRPIYEICTGA